MDVAGLNFHAFGLDLYSLFKKKMMSSAWCLGEGFIFTYCLLINFFVLSELATVFCLGSRRGIRVQAAGYLFYVDVLFSGLTIFFRIRCECFPKLKDPQAPLFCIFESQSDAAIYQHGNFFVW